QPQNRIQRPRPRQRRPTLPPPTLLPLPLRRANPKYESAANRRKRRSTVQRPIPRPPPSVQTTAATRPSTRKPTLPYLPSPKLQRLLAQRLRLLTARTESQYPVQNRIRNLSKRKQRIPEKKTAGRNPTRRRRVDSSKSSRRSSAKISPPWTLAFRFSSHPRFDKPQTDPVPYSLFTIQHLVFLHDVATH